MGSEVGARALLFSLTPSLLNPHDLFTIYRTYFLPIVVYTSTPDISKLFYLVQWNLDLRACKIRANPDLRAISVPTIFLLSKTTSK